MRTMKRPRKYVAKHWLTLMRPVLRYSRSRDAYVLRGLGHRIGPVLRVDRRRDGLTGRSNPFNGVDRRGPRAA
jgi:hypothetical protein